MSLDGVTLEKFKFVVLACVTEELASEFVNEPDVAFSLFETWAEDTITVRVKQEILGEHLERAEVRYPLNWKEAVKDRFAPEWFKARWPVREKVVKIDVRALYPKMSIPEDGVIHVLKTERTESNAQLDD